MQVSVFDKQGKQTERKVSLPDQIFKTKVNQALLNQAVYVYLNNQRESNAHTKDRGAVSGGGKKPWRQKGTGRARHGSTRSPIWRKGGVTFGPTNERNYSGVLSKKMRKGAIRSALSLQMSEKKVLVFEALDVKEKQATKSLAKVLSTIKDFKQVLIIQATKDNLLVNAAANLPEVTTTIVDQLNVYTLLDNNYLIILEPALEKINEYWNSEVQAEKGAVK